MAPAQTADAIKVIEKFFPEQPLSIAKRDVEGDIDQVSKRARHRGKGGAFVTSLRQDLLSGSIQLARHSLKDIPGGEETPGLVIGAYLPRRETEDALVLRSDLSMRGYHQRRGAGYRIGTNSVRRAAQLKRLFPKVEVIHFRGAADTRLRKLEERIPQRLSNGEYTYPADGLVMAWSGLRRVGLSGHISHIFGHDERLPPAGQGIVVLECAENDWRTRDMLFVVNDARSQQAALAERELVWLLNGHCNSPIVVHARIANEAIRLDAEILSVNGGVVIGGSKTGPADRPRELGRDLGLQLLSQGAADLIDDSRLSA